MINFVYEHPLAEIFPGLIWDRITASSHFKNEQKLTKIVYIIPYFLVLYFGEHFKKIGTKIGELTVPT